MLIARALEVIESPLYDTLSMPLGLSTADRAQMFIHPIGSNGFNDPLTGEPRIKDFTETNMLQSGQLPSPQRFAIRSIRAALFSRRGEIMPVVSRYYRGAILELLLAGKPYWASPLWKVADPATMFASGSALEVFLPNERVELIRALRCTFTQAIPVIEEMMPFYVNLKIDPSFDWLDLRAPGSLVVLLEGEFARGVI